LDVTQTYLSTTSQQWKWRLVLGVNALSALLIIHSAFTKVFVETYFAVMLGIAAFAWACFSIRCPKCHVKFLWIEIRGTPIKQGMQSFFSMQECRFCAGAPAPQPLSKILKGFASLVAIGWIVMGVVLIIRGAAGRLPIR
jgi:hypothetical protein